MWQYPSVAGCGDSVWTKGAGLRPATCAGLLAMLPVLAATSSSAQPAVGLAVGYQRGETSYDVEFPFESAVLDAIARGRSRLDWPLDALVASGSVAWRQPAPRVPWEVAFSVGTNLTDPGGEMLDRDWTGVPELQIPMFKWAATRSDCSLHMLVVESTLWLHLAGGFDPWTIPAAEGAALGFGYRHEHYAFRALGVDGWIDEGSGRVPIDIPTDTTSLTYDTDRAMPFAALRLPLAGPFSPIRLDAELRAALLHVLDRDDHVLRNKRFRATAWGAAGGAALTGRAYVAGQPAALRLGIGVRLEASYERTFTGTLSQQYYGDDPGIPGNQTGTPIPDSGYFVETKRWAAWLTTQLEF